MTAKAAAEVLDALNVVVDKRGPTHSTGANGRRKIWPPFSHVDVLVLLILDSLMAPEDVNPTTAALDAPSKATMTHWTGYSKTYLNESTVKLIDHGYIRKIWPTAKHWRNTPLYGLNDDGRALLARLFPPQPPR